MVKLRSWEKMHLAVHLEIDPGLIFSQTFGEKCSWEYTWISTLSKRSNFKTNVHNLAQINVLYSAPIKHQTNYGWAKSTAWLAVCQLVA